jgi:rhodanese-related sulfurtransferase
MTAQPIDVHAAQRLISDGALLVDVREPDEHARERIPNARLVPLSRLTTRLNLHGAPTVIFHCHSGSRTAAAADKLAALAGGDAYILSGGLEAWKTAGFSVLKDRSRPIEMMRQVQIVAGSLVLLGIGFGAVLHPAFYALAGLVGAGLLFAGTTGTCGMARILALAPWNRAHSAMA